MKQIYTIKGAVIGAALLSGGMATVSSKVVYIEQDGVRYYWSNTKTNVEVTSPAKGSTYIGDIVIPASITYEEKELKVSAVRSSAFSECVYLTSVTLPSSVTSIGDYAFDSCEGIKKVVMPGVKTIGHWSFRNCYELESLEFSEKLTSIGNYCFDKNLKITEVTLPATVTNIGGYAFEGNPQLTKVTCYATTPPAIKKGYLDGDEIYTIFDDADYGDRVLYVPAGCVEAYKASLGWHHFRDNIREIVSGSVSTPIEHAVSVDVVAFGSGSVRVTCACDTHVDIIDLNGRCVKSVDLKQGTAVVNGLPAGILVVNGVKVLVRP